MKKISAHVLVKNEARFVWYSIMSVLPHVDKLIIYDTGSTDGTLKLIETIVKKPVISKEDFDEQNIRQQMLDEDDSDWFIVVDGDEIWWDESIKKLTNLIHKKGDDLESIIVPTILPVGDIFHYQETKASGYEFDTNKGLKVGHYALRAINRKIPGLSSMKPHGQWGWTDEEGKMIQDRDQKKREFVDAPYLHVTHLQRAGNRLKDSDVFKRLGKLKYELGTPFPSDFYYPEVFFREKPDYIISPWRGMSKEFKFRAFFETPLRKIRRRLIPRNVGY